MKKLLSIIILMSVITACAATKPLSFDGAKWIWHQGAGDAAGTWYFQKGFSFPAGQKPKKAQVIITCDNLWTLYVNGKKVGENDPGRDSWQRPQIVDVTEHLVIEQNAIAIEAVNTIPGPSGLIMKMEVEFEDGKTYQLITDQSWIATDKPEKSWNENGFTAGAGWKGVVVAGEYGMAPWGMVQVYKGKHVTALENQAVNKPAPTDQDYPKATEFTDEIYRDGIVFVGNSFGFNVSGQDTYVQFIRGTRAYFEMDPMTPAAIGSQLWSLVPFRPDGIKTLLYSEPGSKIGSPSVSYDGKTVYFSLAKKDEAYFHVYKIDLRPVGAPGLQKTATESASMSDATVGSVSDRVDLNQRVQQLTFGPFHDYDPVELPDGRIAFSSTRIGNREEYHAKYASSIFTIDKGGKIRPLTYHIAADREPRVMSDGSLVFIRMDNFLERAKVEVHLHQTRMDGTGGQVIIGPGRKGIKIDRDAAAEHDMGWLRQYGVGSPAPMPDGRVAAINQKGLVTSAEPTGHLIGGGFLPYDLSPLPDGQLLCTSLHKSKVLIYDPKGNGVKEVVTAAELGVKDLHSVVHLGARKKPPVMPSQIDPEMERRVDKTGFLYCQNVLNTQHSASDLKRIKAVRIYEGKPFTLEPTKSIYEHIGTVGIELGTVPLAEDGSFYAEVPADRPLAMQAVDGEGRAVISELTWVYTRPGEQRSCVGCHAPVNAAPQMMTSKALKTKPLKLLGQGDPHRFRANNGANGGIVNLQLDRFREAAAINLFDQPARSAGRTSEVRPALRGGLKDLLPESESGDNHADLSTVCRLGILRDRSAVPTLAKALKSKDVELRVAAALSLSACGNRDAVKPLMDTLSDRNPIVRRAVANALEHLTGISAPSEGTGPTTGDDANCNAPGEGTGPTMWNVLESDLIKKLSSEDLQEVHLSLETLGHIGGNSGAKAIREYLAANPDGELRILMAAIRSLGYLQDKEAIPMLTQIMNDNLTKKGKGGNHEFGFGQKPIYLCATAAEALGRIGVSDPSLPGNYAGASKTIVEAFAGLNSFEDYVFRTAEHGWLQGVHSSVVHFRMLEALDRMESREAGPIVLKIIESIPADKDRGLLYELDSYEKLTARVIARSGRNDEVVEACFEVLGRAGSMSLPELINAVGRSPHAEGHIRKHSAQARAAQVLSICATEKYAPRIKTLLEKYRGAEDSETRNWCCFLLARTLGRLGDVNSVSLFIDMLENDPTETAIGLNLPPAHIIYKGWRPFYRPAAAWSLGELKAKEAVPVLMKVVQDLDNASSTREQAAVALGKIGDIESLEKLKEIAEEYPEITTRRAILESVEGNGAAGKRR